ncbi:hypothetical protein Tco_1357188 [Tanacetum coccineum]
MLVRCGSGGSGGDVDDGGGWRDSAGVAGISPDKRGRRINRREGGEVFISFKGSCMEVNVCQPSGFEDPDFPDRRGKIDKTLFIRRIKSDILLVQVYVNDIIFGSTKKSLCIEFEKMMHKKFQMSSIASTPMETQNPLLKDADGEDVDQHLYRSMIGSLMYLTSSRPDILFSQYLKGQPKLGLWYPKDSPFDLVAYTDSDYAGASLDRKSTTGGCQFLGYRLISWQCKKQTVVANSTTKAEYISASNCCG